MMDRIEEMEERISGADTIKTIDTTFRENAKIKKDSYPKYSANPGYNEKTKPKDNRYRKSEDSQLKDIFNKIIEENFPNLKKEMNMNIQKAYRTPNRLDQERHSSRHIVVKTRNTQNKKKNTKSSKK